MSLPYIASGEGLRVCRTLSFGGYDHRIAAGDGAIWDEENMSGDDAPVLRPRAPRRLLTTIAEPGGLGGHDGLYWNDGAALYCDGVQVGTLPCGGEKTFCALGRRLVIMPDKMVYTPPETPGNPGTLEPMGIAVQARCTFSDGTYAGVPAEANTILAEDAARDWSTDFRIGDAVRISGAADEANNQTIIIREIDGNALRFYENSFTVNATAAEITVAREVPDLDFLCENDNRLWGCRGDTVYASKLGDPFNWNVFDGLASDSWAMEVGSEGDFTACCSYLGYPIFFKEDRVYKVYGSRPSNFELISSASLGVAEGAARSLAVAGETLFYLSRAGLMAYSGGMPRSLATPFGGVVWTDAVGGSDGLKYYVSMRSAEGWSIFTYDTQRGVFHREDGRRALAWARDGGALWLLDAEGQLWQCPGAREIRGAAEETFDSMVEFADFTESSTAMGHRHKGLTRLLLRLELDEGAALTLSVQYDSDGIWHEAAVLGPGAKRSVLVPLVPRRCDHFRLKLTGRGMWRLWSLVRESRGGSEYN